MATANLNEPTSASNGNIPYIGAAENDGTGNTLREAINRINARIKELYGSQDGSNVVQTPFIDGDNIKDDTIDSQHYVDGSIDNAHLADNAVDHDELANRYTAIVTKSDTSGTGASAIDMGWDDGTVFNFTATLTGAIELKFDAYKVGQVIDIYGLTGSYTITFTSTGTGTTTVNNVGAGEYDGTATNHIQVVCLKEGNDPVFNYATATYTSDNSPNA